MTAIPAPFSAEIQSEITAMIRAETQAFIDRDFVAWSQCWMQDARAMDVYFSTATGLTVIEGWAEISDHMAKVMRDDFVCKKVAFDQDNLRLTVTGTTAWAVFEQRGEYADGAETATFETRVLECGVDGWRIIYASCATRRDDAMGHGLISLNETGRVIWASPTTMASLKDHPVLTISGGRLRAHRQSWDNSLQEAIAKAGQLRGYFALQRFAEETGAPFGFPAILGESDEGGMVICHLSVRDGVTYLQMDGDGLLERRLAVAGAVFGLSAGQLGIARHIAMGRGLKEAATLTGISINTARTHLARLYEKTGVNTQTALVRLILSVG